MSACAATCLPSRERDSKQTSVLPSSAEPSISKATSAVPSAFSGVSVVVAVTSAPSCCQAFPVEASMRVPVRTYSLPGVRPV